MKPEATQSSRGPRRRLVVLVASLLGVILVVALFGLRWVFPVEWRVRAALRESQLNYVRIEPRDGRVNVDVGVEIDNALDSPSVPYEVAVAGTRLVDWVFIDRYVSTLRIEYFVFGRPVAVVTHEERPMRLRPPAGGWLSKSETIAYYSDAASYAWVDHALWAEATGDDFSGMLSKDDLPREGR